MKTTPYTQVNKTIYLNLASRCGAKTRAGTLCRCPAVKNRPRCRLHGCAKGSGAPRGNNNALTHGQTTAEIRALRREIRQIIADAQMSYSQCAVYLSND